MRTKATIGIVVLVVGLGLAGCSTTNLTTNTTGWSDYAEILTKDYEVVGHVRVETSETKTVSPLALNTTIEGSKVTYDALLQEAIDMGADDVINVRIDRVEDSSSGLLQFLTGYETNYTYYGNGIAITYLEPLADSAPTQSHPDAELGGSGFGSAGAFELPLPIPSLF